jgi:hypothetical protein
MLSFYLFADVLSGFFVIQAGIDIKFSLLYKIILFVFLLTMIARYQFKLFITILFILFTLLVSTVAELFRLPVITFFIADFSAIIKILMPLVVFIYLNAIYNFSPRFTERAVKFALWANWGILVANLAVGALGFGSSSYTLSDDTTVGSNGYIYAANELGAALIVLFGFTLHSTWNYNRKYYIGMALLTLLCGLLVATKTAMIASFMLVFLTPLFNERKLFFRLTWLKIKLILPALIFIVVLVIFIVDFLKSLGIHDKMVWILSQKGVIGIIWSGRDEFSQNLLSIYVNNSTLFQQIFGQGAGGISEHIGSKYAAEVDGVDAFVWFGFFGLFICLAMPVYFICRSSKTFLNSNSNFSPCVLLVNLLLLFLSQLSGHVWMSGTLGISLGLLNALLLLESKENEAHKMKSMEKLNA